MCYHIVLILHNNEYLRGGASSLLIFEEKQQSGQNSAMGEITDLPKTLVPGTVATLFEGAKGLAIAADDRLTIYRLLLDSNRSAAREVASHRLPGQVSTIAESTLGLLIATELAGRSTVSLIREKDLTTILELSGKITQLAAAGGQAYAVTFEAQEHQSHLIQIDLRQRAAVARRPLDHTQMKLSVDSTGQHLILTDIMARKITKLGSDLKPKSSPPTQPSAELRAVAGGEHNQHRNGPPDRLPHEPGCCCICCKLTDKEEQTRPQPSPSGGETPQQPEEPGPDYEGEDGVPSDDGGIVVGNGDRVDHHSPSGQGKPPCGRRLFWSIAALQRLGGYVLASDRSTRHVALLSADMNLVDEWQFGRGGALLLTAEGTSALVMHIRDSGKWVWHDAYEIVSNLRPWLDQFPTIQQETKTFIGQQSYTMSLSLGKKATHVKALLLPVIEGTQWFSSANLNGFGAYMKRTMVPVIKDYYHENSFGTLSRDNLSITIFGVDDGLVPAQGPLRLRRPKLKDYYFPAYKPAKVELVKGDVDAASMIVFDGRESLTIDAKPLTGGPEGAKLTLPFFAIAFQREEKLFSLQVKFLGTETFELELKTPAGGMKTLKLKFPAKVIDISADANVADMKAKLDELGKYLDNVMKAAELAAGITTRLFAPPKLIRIAQVGMRFGRLLVTFSAANTTGNKLTIKNVTSTLPGGDPMGLANPMRGTMTVGDTGALSQYMENVAVLAQEAEPTGRFGYNARLLKEPKCNFTYFGRRLDTTIAISDRYGGPGAEVKVIGSSGLETLFETATSEPNSPSTINNSESLRDNEDFLRDVFSAAIDQIRNVGKLTNALEKEKVLHFLQQFSVVLVMPIEAAIQDPKNKDAVLPSEFWDVSPLDHYEISFRGRQIWGTIIDRKDESIRLQTNWTLDLMKRGGMPDNPLICHELGHALGYGDLYHQTGYRDDLAYMGQWAMMDYHPDLSHHCGYHKLQSGWIPEGASTEEDYGRVFPLGLPDPSHTKTWELLLVPIELWRESLVGSSRAAFGVGEKVPVVQLASIDFGGDATVFGLIEARQWTKGSPFSKHLPGDGGILITNGITWKTDERFATAGLYRRSLHLLNPKNILRRPGDQFDLALAPELPVKGMRVELLDLQLVEGDAWVYRVRVSRENAEFVDLYFSEGDPYYKSPDLWVDWPGNNEPKPENLNPDYPVGQPTDQGEEIRVDPAKAQPHWVVARLRNKGQVKAINVKLNFYYFDPPGGGDTGKPMNPLEGWRYKFIGSTTVPEIPGKNDPQKIKVKWDVPPGFSGHTCLLVHIEDSGVDTDPTGVPLGSSDSWILNNHAQKNVDLYKPAGSSPFGPIEFDFSVHNAGIGPEVAYVEPNGLPYGMKLTVRPPKQEISSGHTAIFHCKLELEEQIIRSGCENDQRFRIEAWRQDAESSARWGGVEYEIRPRKKTDSKLSGTWYYANEVILNGTIAPDPDGGVVHIRLDFENQQARWVTVDCAPGGTFTWSGRPPQNSRVLEAIAWFEGNRNFSSSQSNAIKLNAPTVIR